LLQQASDPRTSARLHAETLIHLSDRKKAPCGIGHVSGDPGELAEKPNDLG